MVNSHNDINIVGAIVKSDPELFIPKFHQVYLAHYQTNNAKIPIPKSEFDLYISKCINTNILCSSFLELWDIYEIFVLELAQKSTEIGQDRVQKFIIGYIENSLMNNLELSSLFFLNLIQRINVDNLARIILVEYYGCLSINAKSRFVNF